PSVWLVFSSLQSTQHLPAPGEIACVPLPIAGSLAGSFHSIVSVLAPTSRFTWVIQLSLIIREARPQIFGTFGLAALPDVFLFLCTWRPGAPALCCTTCVSSCASSRRPSRLCGA